MSDRKTPYMLQYLFNVQRELGRIDGARSRLPRLAQLSARADVRWQRGDSRRHRHRAEPASRIRSSRRSRRSATSRRPSTTRWRSSSRGGSTTDCRCSSATRSRSRPTTAAASARSTATRCSRRTATASSASGGCRSSTCGTASSRRSSTSCRSATGKPFLQDGVGGAILGGWQVSTIISSVERLPERRRPSAPIGRTPAAARTVRMRTGQDPNCRRPAARSSSGSTPTAFVLQRAGHLRQRRPEHDHRTGDLQRRHVDHPELPARRQQDACSSGSRRSTRSTTRSGTTRTRRWRARMYGTINSTRKPMRELQLGLKFVF